MQTELPIEGDKTWISATIIGMLLAWGALVGSLLMEGGELRSLINLPAALLVFGGTLGAATVSFKMSQITGLPGILAKAFTAKTTTWRR